VLRPSPRLWACWAFSSSAPQLPSSAVLQLLGSWAVGLEPAYDWLKESCHFREWTCMGWDVDVDVDLVAAVPAMV